MEADTTEILEFAAFKLQTPQIKNEMEDSFTNFTGRMRYDLMEIENASEGYKAKTSQKK